MPCAQEAVTGNNKSWVVRDDVRLPDTVLFPTVTKARKLFSAGERLANASPLRRVIDLPVDLDIFDDVERKQIDKFLRALKKTGVHDGYVASNRWAWWSVGLKTAAPILAT